MERFLILSLLLTAVAATSDVDVYWKKTFPNTLMPRAIQELVHLGNGGVNMNTGEGTTINDHRVVFFNWEAVRHGTAAVFRDSNGSETQIQDDPSLTLFFLKKSLRAGTHMNLHFARTVPRAQLLSRSVADSIPFSSSKLPEILRHFGIKPDTAEAATMKDTLLDCDERSLSYETERCVTSLPSMVEFAASALGTRDIEGASTTLPEIPKQTYTIKAFKKLAGTEIVACHAQAYAYAVFYCHKTHDTEVYKVRMEGKDGKTVEEMAVCHDDTKKWNLKHVAFELLNVKRGTVPVCHFLPQDHIVWTVKK